MSERETDTCQSQEKGGTCTSFEHAHCYLDCEKLVTIEHVSSADMRKHLTTIKTVRPTLIIDGIFNHIALIC
jgi:hypothetical protein